MVEAGAWLARRDRGLSGTEQDAFLQWLRDDERHRAALARLECAWTALDSLAQWKPEHSPTPNPRLLASVPRRRSWILRPRTWATALAGAAAVVVAAFIFSRDKGDDLADVRVPQLRVLPPAEQQMLPDGSRLDINHGSQFEIAFTETERRLRLIRGEVHVTVVKDVDRPFIVEAGACEVRAVGTAFAVRRLPEAVDVVVTHGLVRLETPPTASRPKAPRVAIAAGERARLETDARSAPPVVVPISREEMDRELAWQQVRLEFEASPLATVITEFNLRNDQQLVIADPAIGQMRVAGVFRADQVEVFVRLLEASFGVRVERPASGPWVLRKAEASR